MLLSKLFIQHFQNDFCISDDVMIRRYVFIDLGTVDIDLNGKQYTFEVSGEKSENVVIDGKTIDALAFSKFYQILIGANHDGNYVTDIVPETEALLSITFHYRDGQESDTIRFFEAGPRKNYAEVNGEIEFTMMASFVEAVEEALDVVLVGRPPQRLRCNARGYHIRGRAVPCNISPEGQFIV